MLDQGMLGGTVPEPLNEDDATVREFASSSSVRPIASSSVPTRVPSKDSGTATRNPSKDWTVPPELIIDVLENLVSEDQAKIDSILSGIPDTQVMSLVTQASTGLVQTRLRGLAGNKLRTEARSLLFRIAISVGSEIVKRNISEPQDRTARETILEEVLVHRHVNRQLSPPP